MSTRPGMTLAPASLTPFLEQVTGSDKGKVFELGANQLTIGRARENDIIVQSEAVSRLHARLIQSEGAWFIRDNGSKNGISVNGKNVRESWLQNGDIVQVGDFVFRFNDTAVANVQEGAPPAQEPIQEMPFSEPQFGVPPQNASYQTAFAATPQKKKPNRRLLIYGSLILVGALYFVMSGTEPAPTDKKEEEKAKLAREFKTAEEPSLTMDAKPKKLVGLEDPILKEAERAMADLDWTNSSLRQSEQFFKKGQREYLNQNYHRAIEFFQTSIQLYRGHLLAERYLKRAVFEAEIEAKNQMALGIQYFQALQYQRAMYHFNEFIILMSHRPTEPAIAEATKYILQCKQALKAAELFP